MRAAFYSEQGSAQAVLRIGDQPTPQPGPGEVLVKLRTSGVNPSDWKVRKGGFGRGMVAPTVIPHSDGAGVIDAVGAGATNRKVGERVWIWNGQWRRAFGTAAEYISVPSIQAVPLPDSVGFDEGACLGIPALTAIHAVRAVGAGPGRTVFIVGGAGAVASCAIQIAKARGARVITTVSSDAKAAHARQAGADEIVNYRTEDVGARLKDITGGAGVDSAIEMDLTRNAKHYPEILRPNSIVAIYGMSGLESTLPGLWMMQNSITLRFLFVYTVSEADRRDELAELTALLACGAVKPIIAQRFSLEESPKAHDAVESGGLIGNVIIDI
ncbi:MAG TPA: NADPH:quinone reductase [Sphingomicrobium sp.]|nr:NADPH:quinone reductase [Sphingomicrobium sp.]